MPDLELLGRAGALAAQALPALADGALKGTIVLGAAALATRLLRRAGAATRHLIWSTAVVAVLALPVLSLVAPRWGVPVAARRLPVVMMPATPEVSAPIALADAIAADSVVAPPADVRAVAMDGGHAAVAPVVAAAPTTHRTPSLAEWAAIVWAVGGLLVLARLALGTLGLARLVRRATPADDASWVMLIQRLSRELGIRRPVTLLVGRTGTVPVTWGVVYPVVLLPADADTWSEERRRAVLLHELAHVERFDALTHVLSQLALAVFWFHPLVWTAARRLRAERERACDDLVLAAGTRATAYADDLLDLVQTLGEASPAAAALAMARRSEFEGRLLAILDPAVPRARTTRRAAVAALAVAALAVVPLAGARAVVRAEPAPVASAQTVPAPNETRLAQPPVLRDDQGRPVDEARLQQVAARIGTPAAGLAGGVAALDDERKALGASLATLAKSNGACTPRAGRHVSIDDTGARWYTRLTDGRRCLDVTVDGKMVELSDDDSEVAALAPNGTLVVTETRDGVTREAVVRERGGRMEYSFLRDGVALAGERLAEARAWLGGALRDAARESGLGMPARVARIRRQRGVEGVLRELRNFHSDGMKRAWLATLLDAEDLSRDELRRTAVAAANYIVSDGDKASVLRTISARAGGDPAVGMAVVTASNTIVSDGDRRGVLRDATEGPRASAAVLTYAAQSARSIASDGDKAAILRTFAARAGELPALRAAIADAANTISSDGDRASVLVALLDATPDDSTLILAMRAGSSIASPGDRRRVAAAALARTRLDGARVRDAFFSLTDAIHSDGDKGAVLSAVVRRRDLPQPALVAALRGVSRLSSDGAKARVLLDVTARPEALEDSAARAAFFDALRTISSGGDYRRVMERVAR